MRKIIFQTSMYGHDRSVQQGFLHEYIYHTLKVEETSGGDNGIHGDVMHYCVTNSSSELSGCALSPTEVGVSSALGRLS